MTITLTREEAQQVLDELLHLSDGLDAQKAIELLRAKLSEPENEFNPATRSKKMREAGITRRPKGWSKEDEPEPEAFKIYKPTPPRLGLPDVKIDALPWVYDQDPSSGYVASMWVVPANLAPPQREPEPQQNSINEEFGRDGRDMPWAAVRWERR